MKPIEPLNSNQTYELIVVIFNIHGKCELKKTIGLDRIERKRPLGLNFILFYCFDVKHVLFASEALHSDAADLSHTPTCDLYGFHS